MTGELPGAAPEPWQVEQVASLTRLTVVVAPLAASSNERWSSVSRILATVGARSPRAAPRRPGEQAAEDVAEVARVAGEPLAVPRSAAEAATHAGAHGTELADLVVLLALLGIPDHVVGGGDLLEALLGLGVARVGVGVVLPGPACGRRG